MTAAAPRGSASYLKDQRPAQVIKSGKTDQGSRMSRRDAVPAAAKATWARRSASGCRKHTLRRRFCRPIKHEVGRQLNLWRSVGHLDSLRDQNQSCCSTSRRSRKSTTDPLNMEHMRKQAGRKLAWTRCYRYTSSSDQLRVALLKLQPASRRGEHGRREAPYPIHRRVPVWRCSGHLRVRSLKYPSFEYPSFNNETQTHRATNRPRVTHV